MRWALLLGLAGCKPAVAVMGDVGYDSASTATTDGTEGTTDSGPPPAKTWTGSRDFVFGNGNCDDTLTESGTEVGTDPSYADQVSTCASCTMFFALNLSPSSMCNGWVTGYPLQIVRAMEPTGGDSWRIYAIDGQPGSWSRSDLADATYDGSKLTYAYSSTYYGVPYTVNGSATIE